MFFRFDQSKKQACSWGWALRRFFIGTLLLAVIFGSQVGKAQNLNSGEFVPGVATQAPAPQSEVPRPAQQIRVGGNVQQAKLISSTNPEYPLMAKSAGVQGAVVLEAVISKQGTVGKLNVISGNRLLVRAAMEAVKKWQYRPTLLNDDPVEVITTITVNFHLNGDQPGGVFVARAPRPRPKPARQTPENKIETAAAVAAPPPPQPGNAGPIAEGEPKPTPAVEGFHPQPGNAGPAPETKSTPPPAVEASRTSSKITEQSVDSKPDINALAGNAGTLSGLSGRKDPEFIIGPEDGLSIDVWREPELTTAVVVRPDGKITLPLINEIQASGLTTKQLQDRIAQRLKDFVVSPVVTVMVKEIRSQSVTIMGEVSKTGVYPFGSPMTVVELIGRAGGFKEYAKTTKIRILRQEDGRQIQFPFNYKDYIKGKNPEQNIVLKNDDTVIVP